jgi:hypothetical protein
MSSTGDGREPVLAAAPWHVRHGGGGLNPTAVGCRLVLDSSTLCAMRRAMCYMNTCGMRYVGGD